jgi:hypothetical protein
MFDQLASVEEERRQGITMDERGGELMLVSPRPLDRIGLDGLPAIVTQAGEQVRWRFLEFFTANIRNKNTRMAYVRATGPFLAWSEQRGIGDLQRLHRLWSPPALSSIRACPRRSSGTWPRSACSSIGWSPARSCR